jgi:hypothetical protein
VVRLSWPTLEPDPLGHWLVTVDYDLGRSFGLWRHRSPELAVAEDW